jgi:isoleucyl-tRNA synthetase
VHLADWPDAADLPADPDLVRSMDRVRDVCSTALSIRKARGLRVRLPLRRSPWRHPTPNCWRRSRRLIADEVNVKEVVLTTDLAAVASTVLQVVPATLGPRLGGDTQKVIKAVKAGDWTAVGDTVVAAGITLHPGEFSLRLTPAAGDRSACLPGERRRGPRRHRGHPRAGCRGHRP